MTRKERSDKMKAIWASKRLQRMQVNNNLPDIQIADEPKRIEVLLNKSGGIMQSIEIRDQRGSILNYQFDGNTSLNIQEK